MPAPKGICVCIVGCLPSEGIHDNRCICEVHRVDYTELDDELQGVIHMLKQRAANEIAERIFDNIFEVRAGRLLVRDEYVHLIEELE